MLALLLYTFALGAEPCVDLAPYRMVQPGHFRDGAIHLVPSYRAREAFQGYLVVALDEGLRARGIAVGDVLLELDGVKPSPPAPGRGTDDAFFARLKTFKAAKVERCQRLTLP